MTVNNYEMKENITKQEEDIGYMRDFVGILKHTKAEEKGELSTPKTILFDYGSGRVSSLNKRKEELKNELGLDKQHIAGPCNRIISQQWE